MRFRPLQMSDLPDITRLYTEYLEESSEVYPNTNERSAEEYIFSLYNALVNNPNFFCIVGVVDGRVHEDAQGNKHTIGGRAKAYVQGSLIQRPLGEPKIIGLIDLVIVDSKFRKHSIARALIQRAATQIAQRGAQVLECAWTPGSLGEEIALAAGMKPYRTLGAWVTDDGTPRGDMPMVKEKTKRTRKPRVKKGEEVANESTSSDL